MFKLLNSYFWPAKNKFGKQIKSNKKPPHIDLLRAELQSKELTPLKIHKQIKKVLFKKNISNQDVCIFSRQVATLLASGVSFIKILEWMVQEHPKMGMKNLIKNIKQNIENGKTIAESLNNYPQQFNPLYCNLVAAGEQAGKLEIIFDRIANYQEKINSLRNKIKKALIYPFIVILVGILITIGLLVFVVPQFESLFNSFDAQLPLITRIIIKLSNDLQHYGLLSLFLLGVFTSIIVFLKQHSPVWAEKLDKKFLQIPYLGNLLKKSAIARFTRTLATLLVAGLPLLDALKIVAGTTGSYTYNKIVLNIRDSVTTGRTLQFSLQQTRLFPGFVIQMVALGEASGTLEVMLNKIADIFESEVDQATNSLMTMLEPVITLVLGGLIGILVIAMYLPIFKLGSLM